MTFNKNTNLIGKHSFLSPSSYQWVDYDEDKLTRVYYSKQEARRGEEIHEYAMRAIRLRIKQADNGSTLSRYINDAIGYHMTPEVPLFYSYHCFGTADAVGILDNILRIHDLKNGITPASMKQLLIYTGIFFFEYRELFRPSDTPVVLRIYQNNDIEEHEPEVEEILWYMDRIKTQSNRISYLRGED